jgi:hypothetical protein
VPARGARGSVAGVVVVAVAALALGGGCSSTGPKAGTEKFVGAWTFDSGALNATCMGLPPFASGLTGQTVTLTTGTKSDLVSTLETTMGTCTLMLTVSGSVASANAGQSCTFMVMVPPLGTVPVTVDITTWTVTLNAMDETKMTTAATAVGNGGLANGCPVTLSGAATKHAGDASAG